MHFLFSTSSHGLRFKEATSPLLLFALGIVLFFSACASNPEDRNNESEPSKMNALDIRSTSLQRFSEQLVSQDSIQFLFELSVCGLQRITVLTVSKQEKLLEAKVRNAGYMGDSTFTHLIHQDTFFLDANLYDAVITQLKPASEEKLITHAKLSPDFECIIIANNDTLCLETQGGLNAKIRFANAVNQTLGNTFPSLTLFDTLAPPPPPAIDANL